MVKAVMVHTVIEFCLRGEAAYQLAVYTKNGIDYAVFIEPEKNTAGKYVYIPVPSVFIEMPHLLEAVSEFCRRQGAVLVHIRAASGIDTEKKFLAAKINRRST